MLNDGSGRSSTPRNRCSAAWSPETSNPGEVKYDAAETISSWKRHRRFLAAHHQENRVSRPGLRSGGTVPRDSARARRRWLPMISAAGTAIARGAPPYLLAATGMAFAC